MALKRPSIPALSAKTPSDIRRAITSLVDHLTGVGRQQELAEQSIRRIAGDLSSVGVFSAQPAPTGLVVTGAFNTIILQWDQSKTSGFSHTEVWRSPEDNLSNAQPVGSTSAYMFGDTPPDSSLSKTYYYWIRYVNQAGQPGPYNDTAGTPGKTADDPAYVLEVLTDEITEGQLYKGLNERIDKIDLNIVTEGDVYDTDLFSGMDDIYNSLFQQQADFSGTLDLHLSLIDNITGKVQRVEADHQDRLGWLESVAPGIEANRTSIGNVETTLSFDIGEHNTRIQSLESEISGLESEITGLTTTEWASTSGYTEGQYVRSGDKVWRCTQTHEAPSPEPVIGSAYWEESEAIHTLVSSVDARVSELEGEIVTKVAQTSFDSLSSTVSRHETSITQNATEIETKASQVDLDTIGDTVSSHATSIAQNADSIALKASQADFNVLEELVSTNQTNITQNADAIALKASQLDLDAVEVTATNAESQVNIESGRINMVSASITGPISYEPGEVHEDGTYVEWAGDVANVEGRVAISENILSAHTDELTSQAASLLSLQGAVDGNTADLVSESKVRADADSALASDITALRAGVDNNVASIIAESTARADADSALAQDITTLASSVDDNTAAIQTEQVTRADADEAMAGQITTISSSATGPVAYAPEEEMYEDGTYVEGVEDVQNVDGRIATAQSIINTHADRLTSQASSLFSLEALAAENSAQILEEQTVRASADEAIASDLSVLQSKVGWSESAIRSEQVARADGDSALAQDITTLITSVDNNTSAIQTEQTARADADSALAQDITTLQTTVDGNTSAIQTEQTARADGDSALAQDITTLQTTVNGHTTSLQTKAEVSDLNSVYEVKIDGYNRVTGFGLFSSTESSEFTVIADRFAVMPSDNTTGGAYPFVVENGKAYLQGAVIQDATIGGAKIANLAVDNAKIATSAISNTKIANAAITNTKIADAAITNAKIANAAITNAKIGDAAVDTLHIAGNAVTIPDVGLQVGTLDLTGDPSTELHILATASIYLDEAGYVLFWGGCNVTHGEGWQDARVSLWLNGVQKAIWGGASGVTGAALFRGASLDVGTHKAELVASRGAAQYDELGFDYGCVIIQAAKR
jgi:hypothetical protein